MIDEKRLVNEIKNWIKTDSFEDYSAGYILSDVIEEINKMPKVGKWLYEDDGEEHDGCDDCKYEYKKEGESPCTECCNNYMSKWEPRPKKTRQDEFLEMFPNAKKRKDILTICPDDVDVDYNVCESYPACEECRRDYWLQEVEE